MQKQCLISVLLWISISTLSAHTRQINNIKDVLLSKDKGTESDDNIVDQISMASSNTPFHIIKMSPNTIELPSIKSKLNLVRVHPPSNVNLLALHEPKGSTPKPKKRIKKIKTLANKDDNKRINRMKILKSLRGKSPNLGITSLRLSDGKKQNNSKLAFKHRMDESKENFGNKKLKPRETSTLRADIKKSKFNILRKRQKLHKNSNNNKPSSKIANFKRNMLGSSRLLKDEAVFDKKVWNSKLQLNGFMKSIRKKNPFVYLETPKLSNKSQKLAPNNTWSKLTNTTSTTPLTTFTKPFRRIKKLKKKNPNIIQSTRVTKTVSKVSIKKGTSKKTIDKGQKVSNEKERKMEDKKTTKKTNHLLPSTAWIPIIENSSSLLGPQLNQANISLISGGLRKKRKQSPFPTRNLVNGEIPNSGGGYEFHYTIRNNESSISHTREEMSDPVSGIVIGSYEVMEPGCIIRRVEYRADPANGFEITNTTKRSCTSRVKGHHINQPLFGVAINDDIHFKENEQPFLTHVFEKDEKHLAQIIKPLMVNQFQHNGPNYDPNLHPQSSPRPAKRSSTVVSSISNDPFNSGLTSNFEIVNAKNRDDVQHSNSSPRTMLMNIILRPGEGSEGRSSLSKPAVDVSTEGKNVIVVRMTFPEKDNIQGLRAFAPRLPKDLKQFKSIANAISDPISQITRIYANSSKNRDELKISRQNIFKKYVGHISKSGQDAVYNTTPKSTPIRPIYKPIGPKGVIKEFDKNKPFIGIDQQKTGSKLRFTNGRKQIYQAHSYKNLYDKFSHRKDHRGSRIQQIFKAATSPLKAVSTSLRKMMKSLKMFA